MQTFSWSARTATQSKAERCVFILSHPQDTFPVKSASTLGATVTFKQGQDMLTHKEGTNFNIHVHGKLYYLQALMKENAKCVTPVMNSKHSRSYWVNTTS